MAKEYVFTIKHYPVNDLLALDLQEHLEQMAKTGWELTNTQQLVNDHSSGAAFGVCCSVRPFL